MYKYSSESGSKSSFESGSKSGSKSSSGSNSHFSSDSADSDFDSFTSGSTVDSDEDMDIDMDMEFDLNDIEHGVRKAWISFCTMKSIPIEKTCPLLEDSLIEVSRKNVINFIKILKKFPEVHFSEFNSNLYDDIRDQPKFNCVETICSINKKNSHINYTLRYNFEQDYVLVISDRENEPTFKYTDISNNTNVKKLFIRDLKKKFH